MENTAQGESLPIRKTYNDKPVIYNRSQTDFTDLNIEHIRSYIKYLITDKVFQSDLIMLGFSLFLVMCLIMTRDFMTAKHPVITTILSIFILVLCILQVAISLSGLWKTFKKVKSQISPDSTITIYDGIIRGLPIEGIGFRALVRIPDYRVKGVDEPVMAQICPDFIVDMNLESGDVPAYVFEVTGDKLSYFVYPKYYFEEGLV